VRKKRGRRVKREPRGIESKVKGERKETERKETENRGRRE
jgi:hypothetical protein